MKSEERSEMHDAKRNVLLLEECIERLSHVARAPVQFLLKRRAAFAQMEQRSAGRRQCERMPDERAREKGHVRFGRRIVAELPEPAIKSVHAPGLAGQHTNGKAAADH